MKDDEDASIKDLIDILFVIFKQILKKLEKIEQKLEDL